ncbi:hypothetical protein PR202_gb15234 [Eleusine coracana subsp. coracana]|uniref:HORMA domain-containing protein n=1 Tax=Eleusine coracana subsp. coracana TaxID=191504 RepID=A0AAV5EXQ5_ELECO|nr:hypothetical protein PR202_gb15234 [Eleusine coracana subsp. coracana]
MASRTVSKDIITLRGSAAIVSEFFGYAANRYATVPHTLLVAPAAALIHPVIGCILYNRGVYPEESFTKVKKYGLTMLLTQDEGVKAFIANLTSQLSGFLIGVACLNLSVAEWLEAGKLQRIVLVIMSQATSEVLERWNFSIETDPEVVEKGTIKEKSDKEIMREIQAIMRQVASCITYLPCLEEPCVFDVLAYTDTDVDAPGTWVESDAKLISNPQMVKLHSFDTKIHKVDTLVSYKKDEWDEESDPDF